MSDMAKSARAAMKAKAMRLGASRPLEKVDSSTFVPPELLNADVKTGLRPVSRRAFKKGGKVMGECGTTHAGRKPRQSGGKAITADSLINRNVKEANELREGKKHVGALKTGGRAGKLSGGALKKYIEAAGEDQMWREGMLGSMGDDRKGHAFNAKQKWEMRKREKGMDLADRKLQKKGYTWDYDEGNWKDPDTRKAGGRAKHATQGKVTVQGPQTRSAMDRLRDNLGFDSPDYDPRSGGSSDASSSQIPISEQDKAGLDALFRDAAKMRKSGGRTKKMDGGPSVGAQAMMEKAKRTAGVPSEIISSVPAQSRFSKTAGLKKGGAAHPDEKMDRALINKMVKPSARTGKKEGGLMDMAKRAIEASRDARKKMDRPAPISQEQKEEAMRADQGDTARKYRKKGGMAERPARKEGGGVFTGPGYPGNIPGVVPGGRTARATGGKTRGKTNINIVIAAGKQPGQDGPMPPMAPGARPGGIPIPVPPPQAGGAMGVGAPMPMPMPMPAPAGGPAGGPPMARKAGGRITKVASSYKDMEAGAAGGEGRLQKTDIAKKDKGAPAYKKGGKVYRSFKDMDAGAASGLGRLEKSEIQSRKG
jgi:hypothetical protein